MDSSSSQLFGDISNGSAHSQVQNIQVGGNLALNHPNPPSWPLQHSLSHHGGFHPHSSVGNILVENPGWHPHSYATDSLPLPQFLMLPATSSYGYGASIIPPPHPRFVPSATYYYIPPSFGPHNCMYNYNPSSLVPPPWAYQATPPHDFSLYWRIINQVNFYFSDKNLSSDFYLKQHMDDNGWVPITLIAGFRRMKQLTSDIRYILFALQGSSIVEVEGDKIRRRKIIRRNNWGRRVQFSTIKKNLFVCETKLGFRS